MDIVVQSVRVAMLALMTFTFAAIWSADYSYTSAAEVRTRVPLNRRPQHDRDRPPYDQPDHHHDISASDSQSIAQTNSAIPLPAGIRAGTYLIVDQAGRTTTRTVTATEANFDGGISQAKWTDHYTTMQGLSRWHFIRIQPTALDRMAVQPESGARLQ